ncbi:MAG: zinc ribbon domain-containing protein [Actinomycetota bacterium]|nr:zinc ribbon domain-containing protein [Actinomycetota bacterium]
MDDLERSDVEPDLDQLKLSDEERAERAKQDDTISSEKSCPECGAPVENLRKTCSKCGYEYKESDYDDTDAGSEFITGSEIDDQGNEVVDESGRVASQRQEQDR